MWFETDALGVLLLGLTRAGKSCKSYQYNLVNPGSNLGILRWNQTIDDSKVRISRPYPLFFWNHEIFKSGNVREACADTCKNQWNYWWCKDLWFVYLIVFVSTAANGIFHGIIRKMEESCWITNKQMLQISNTGWCLLHALKELYYAVRCM